MFQGLGKSQGSHKASNSLGKGTGRIGGLGEAYRAGPLLCFPATSEQAAPAP